MLIGLYPPLLGAGIRVTRMSPDWTSGELVLRVHPWTANLHGAAFGGALFSATDVLYGTMLTAQLGHRFQVWTRSATIDFLSPGKGKLMLQVELPRSEAESIRERVERDRSSEAVHRVSIVDAHGTTIAVAQHVLRIRLAATTSRDRVCTESMCGAPRDTNYYAVDNCSRDARH
ncbi:PaaI family thioesterase [Williamsia sp. SKLECPSW1]